MSPGAEQLRGFRCLSAAAGVWHSREMYSKPQGSISALREALQMQDKERVQTFGRWLDINSPDNDTRLTTPTPDALYFHRRPQCIPSGELN